MSIILSISKGILGKMMKLTHTEQSVNDGVQWVVSGSGQAGSQAARHPGTQGPRHPGTQ